MTSTERKLDEARYFLRQLNHSDPYFDYILSAYLNAARSTTWVMRHEFCKVKGWEDWFTSCKISHVQNVLLKKINQLRILSTKQDGVKSEYYFLDNILVEEEYYPLIKEILDHPEGTEFEINIRPVENKVSEIEDKDAYRIQGRVKFDMDESEMSRKSLLDMCNQYFVFLQQHVAMCIEKFASSP